MAEPNQTNEGQQPVPASVSTGLAANTPPAASPPAVSAAPPPPAVKPAVSPKPTAQPKDAGRRNFLWSSSLGMFFGSWFATAWTTFSLSMVGLTLGTLRFMFPNVLSEPPSTFAAGLASQYEENKVDDQYKEKGAWVIRHKDEQGRDIIYALSTTCTHLGCTPNWLESEKKFKCPCHGSGFKITGVNFEGPAPRPLERYAISKREDGQVIVNKARKFQKEIGQWEDQESYILL